MNGDLLQILKRFTFWNNLDTAERQVVLEGAVLKNAVAEKSDVFELIPKRSIWLVYNGWVDISLQSSAGRQCRIMRVKQNESTYMTLGRETEKYPITASAKKNTEICILPQNLAEYMISSNVYVRDFAMDAAELQVSRLISNIGEIEFLTLKERLMHSLLEHRDNQHSDKITITHEKLADELGSSREVISRLLKQMEKAGMVTLQRGKIIVLENQKSGSKQLNMS